MAYYKYNRGGTKQEIDLTHPIVLLKALSSAEEYQAGRIVYPIADKPGMEPGVPSEMWNIPPSEKGERVIVCSLDEPATSICVKLGKTAINLLELVEIAGSETGISIREINAYGIPGNIQFDYPISSLDSNLEEEIIRTLIEQYNLNQLPISVRNLRAFSPLVSFDTRHYEQGIICDSLDEVEMLLHIYSGALVIDGKKAAKEKLIEDSRQSIGSFAASFLEAYLEDSHREGAGGLLATLICDMKRGVKSRKAFSRHFEYEALETPFFKTSVDVAEVNGKYTLRLNKAGIGCKSETGLANIVGKSKALHRTDSIHYVKPIDEDWVGIDLNQVLRGTGIDEASTKLLAASAAGETEDYSGNYEIVNIGNYGRYALSLIFDQERSRGFGTDTDVRRVRDTQLFYKITGEGRPYLHLIVKPVDKSGAVKRREPIVDDEERKRMIKARDFLRTAVNQNLSA